MATTRIVLRADIIERLYSPSFPTSSESTAGGSTTTILDSVLSPGAESEDYVGAWIYVTELQGSGPAVGSVSRVTQVDFSGSTSTLTLAPAFASATESGMEYEIHYEFHPTEVNNVINEVIRFGARGAQAALSADSSTTTLEQDVVVAGVLARLKRKLSISGPESEKMKNLEAAQQNEIEFFAGLTRAGYPRTTVEAFTWQQQGR